METIILIRQAIARFGSEAKAAAAAGVSQPVINAAKKTGKVGPRLAMGLDKATKGEISKSDLRPDLWPSRTCRGSLMAYPKKVPPFDVLKSLLDSGMSQAAIARQYDVRPESISIAVRRSRTTW